MKEKYSHIKTYKEFAALVKKLKSPPMSHVYKEIGVSDQLGGYYLQQSVINPDGNIKKNED